MAAPGTWFRFMTKHVSASFVAVKPPYHWHEMDFFTRWTSHGRLETICFNTPASVKSQVQVTLLQRTDTSTDDCYAYIALLVNEVVKLYDQSVWLIRDHIRSVEQVSLIRSSLNVLSHVTNQTHPQDRVNHLTSSVDYHYLHDIARHACHSSETLTTAQDVMAAIISQHDDFWLRRGHITNQDKANHKQTNQKLLFQSHMLRAFRSRSLANESRLQNQINLVRNPHQTLLPLVLTRPRNFTSPPSATAA